MLVAGAAKTELDLPTGIPMAGYVSRQGTSQGVHDPLWARAIVLSTNKQTLAIVSLDVLGVDEHLCSVVRSGIEQQTGIAQTNVLVAATHTHSGPAGILADREGYDPGLVRAISQAAIRAVVGAWASRVPAWLGAGSALAEGIATSREDPARPTDRRARVVRLDDEQGKPIGALVHFACHPTVLDHRNLYFSADFPGMAMSALEERISAVAVFLNGAAGDISTRYTRRESTFSEAERFANLLAGASVAAWDGASMCADTSLAIAHRKVILPLAEPMADDRMQELARDTRSRLHDLLAGGAPPAEVRRLQSLLEGLDLLARRRQGQDNASASADIQVLRLGDTVLAGVPGEVLAETAVKIQALVSGANILVVGYANGYLGYLTDRTAEQEPNYEALVARVAPGAVDRIVDAVQNACIDVLRDA